jgi:Ca-activated chloride channel family protein
MRFLWPDLLWLLFVVPALVAGYVAILRRRRKAAVRYASLTLVRDAIGGPSANVTLPSEYMTIALAMDVSRSMQATDVDPNRLSAAQTAARAFIEELPTKVRLGIVSFAGTAAVVQTPTENRQDMLEAIDRFQLQRATATGSGLILALAMLFPDDGIDLESVNEMLRPGIHSAPIDRPRTSEPAAKKGRTPVAPGSFTTGVIILLSDGRRTTGPDPIEVAKLAADRGVRVYTVGFGTREGTSISIGEYSFYVRLDEETLKAIAKLTGGEYFHAGTATDLRKVYQSLNTKIALERKDTEVSALFSAAAAILVLLAALLSILWFHRGAGRPSTTPAR